MTLFYCKYRDGYVCLKQGDKICCSTALDWKICDFYDLNTEEGLVKFAAEQPNESQIDIVGL